MAIGNLINSADGYTRFSLLEIILFSLILAIILSVIFRNQYEIVISEDKISGLASGLFTFMGRETFSINEVDLSRLHQRTYYEKISFYRTIRSITNKKIMVADFIYEVSKIRNLYEILGKESQTLK